jgi:Na+/proline symporter
VFYKANPERLPLEPADYDKVVPYFTVHELPVGVSGLVIAAVFAAAMSSFDSGLNSLSATLTVDWYKRLGSATSERRSLFVAKCLTYVIGAAVTITALVIYWTGVMSIIDASNKYLGFFGGALLAIFFLGALTRRAKALPTVLGALCGVASVFLIDMMADPANGKVIVHTYLYGMISCLVTLVVGYLGSFIGPPPSEQRLAGLTIAGISKTSVDNNVDCEPGCDDIQTSTEKNHEN